MPIFEKAQNTDASQGHFYEVHGNQYFVTYGNTSNPGESPVTTPSGRSDVIEWENSNWQQMVRACSRKTTSCQSILASAIKPGINQTVVTVPYGAWSTGNRDITYASSSLYHILLS